VHVREAGLDIIVVKITFHPIADGHGRLLQGGAGRVIVVVVVVVVYSC
jgi:hypothetical protein